MTMSSHRHRAPRTAFAEPHAPNHRNIIRTYKRPFCKSNWVRFGAISIRTFDPRTKKRPFGSLLSEGSVGGCGAADGDASGGRGALLDRLEGRGYRRIWTAEGNGAADLQIVPIGPAGVPPRRPPTLSGKGALRKKEG